MSLRDIDLKIVKKFLNNLKSVSTGDEASDTIKKKARDGLRHFLNYAVSEGDIPPLSFEWPELETADPVIQYLDPEDQELIIAAAPAEHRPILKWLVKTGRRINEARAMKVRDVIFSKSEYVVINAFDMENLKDVPKEKKTAGAVFPLDDEHIAIIMESLSFKDGIYGPDDFVFSNPRTGGQYTMNSLLKVFYRIRKKAGFPSITLKGFGRQSFATQRLNEGWSYAEVGLFLLNTAQVVKDRYAVVTKAARVAVINFHNNKGRRKEIK